MRSLFVLSVILIAYGSLYPFTVNLEAASAEEWRGFLASWRGPTGLSDALGNIVLFLPFGYFGLAALGPGDGARRPQRRVVFTVIGLGLAEAIVLQIAQIYLPDRVPRLSDAIWNTAGLLIGLGAATLPALRPGRPAMAASLSVPVLLIGLWFGFRLVPFVPSLDVQNVKDSLKPLLLTPLPVNLLAAAHAAAAWLACGVLWRGARGGRPPIGQVLDLRSAAFVMGAVFAAEILIVDNVVTSADVLGACAALAGWAFVLPRLARPERGVALVLAATVVAAGLAPFELRADPIPFEWLPFRGLLGGSMVANVASLLERLFNFGTLIWLLAGLRVPFTVAVLGVVGMAAGLEAAQTVIVGRTPEITDPLLALLIGVAIRLWDGASRRAGPSPSA